MLRHFLVHRADDEGDGFLGPLDRLLRLLVCPVGVLSEQVGLEKELQDVADLRCRCLVANLGCHLANTGKIDCIWNGMSVDSTRAKAMNLSDPYLKNRMIFTVKDKSLASLAALAGKKIAVQNGSTAQKLLDASEAGKAAKEIVPFDDNQTALMDLDKGGVDAVFLDEIVAKYWIVTNAKDYRLPRIRRSPHSRRPAPQGILRRPLPRRKPDSGRRSQARRRELLLRGCLGIQGRRCRTGTFQGTSYL